MAVDFRNLRDQLGQVARQRVDRANRAMTSELKSTAPVDTGELRRVTGVEVVSQTERQVRSEARIDVDYGSFVTMGTRPHVIRARPGGVLRFEVGGKTVFATKVNHPGTGPNDFYDRVIGNTSRYLERAG